MATFTHFFTSSGFLFNYHLTKSKKGFILLCTNFNNFIQTLLILHLLHAGLNVILSGCKDVTVDTGLPNKYPRELTAIQRTQVVFVLFFNIVLFLRSMCM